MEKTAKLLDTSQSLESLQPFTPQEAVSKLIQLAMEKGQSIEVIQALLHMREQLKKEWAKEEFIKALSAFQSDIPKINKNKIVYNKDGTIRYRYATLDQIIKTIKPFLKKHGFSFHFKTDFEDNAVIVSCIVSHKAGHTEKTTFRAVVEKSEYMLPIQEWGSALTYAKRYTLCLAFGIAADEDTDGIIPTAKEQHQNTNANSKNNNSVTPAQLQKIHTLFSSLGIKDREARLIKTKNIIGRDIQSSKELTKQEASLVIEKLEEDLNKDEPIF